MINKEENPEILIKLNTLKELEARIKELEEINAEHQKLNGELREENKELREIIEGKSIQELGTSDLYKED